MRAAKTSLVLAFALGAAVILAAQAQAAAKPLFSTQETMSGTTFSIGGQTYGPFTRLLGPPQFSPDYTAWMVADQREDGSALFVVNGKDFPFPKRVDYVGPGSISNDGSSWAFPVVATEGQGDARSFVFANGKVLGPWESAEVRSDGGPWFAITERKERGAVQRFALAKDRSHGPADEIRDAIFDPATGEYLFILARKEQAYVAHKGKESGPFQWVEPILDGEGALFGYGAQGKAGMEVWIGDRKFGPYEDAGIHDAWVKADRSSWLFVATRKGASVIVKDGKETPVDYAELHHSGSSYLYFATAKGRSFIVDGEKEYGPYLGISNRLVPSSGAWAAEVQKRRGDGSAAWVVIGGAEYPGQDLRFDGTTYRWISIDDEGKGSLMSLPAD